MIEDCPKIIVKSTNFELSIVSWTHSKDNIQNFFPSDYILNIDYKMIFLMLGYIISFKSLDWYSFRYPGICASSSWGSILRFFRFQALVLLSLPHLSPCFIFSLFVCVGLFKRRQRGGSVDEKKQPKVLLLLPLVFRLRHRRLHPHLLPILDEIGDHKCSSTSFSFFSFFVGCRALSLSQFFYTSFFFLQLFNQFMGMGGCVCVYRFLRFLRYLFIFNFYLFAFVFSASFFLFCFW